jgi:hypothetical protein
MTAAAAAQLPGRPGPGQVGPVRDPAVLLWRYEHSEAWLNVWWQPRTARLRFRRSAPFFAGRTMPLAISGRRDGTGVGWPPSSVRQIGVVQHTIR